MAVTVYCVFSCQLQILCICVFYTLMSNSFLHLRDTRKCKVVKKEVNNDIIPEQIHCLHFLHGKKKASLSVSPEGIPQDLLGDCRGTQTKSRYNTTLIKANFFQSPQVLSQSNYIHIPLHNTINSMWKVCESIQRIKQPSKKCLFIYLH